MTGEILSAPHGHSAYRRLLEEIRTGALLPGMRLRETELAERLGLSRTPVREAIRLLESDGLVVSLPRQGATVRSLGHAEVVELYEMRAVLEGTAARFAARSASDLELAELVALNDALAETGPGPMAFDLNRHFHLALLDGAKNSYLTRSAQALQKTLLILGPTTLSEPDRAVAAVKEHRAILDALLARDGARAETAMRAHIAAAHHIRLQGLRLREPLVREG